MKSGNLNVLEPSGPLQACNRTALPLPFGALMITICTVFFMPLYLGVFSIHYIYIHITFCLIYLVYSYVVTTIMTSMMICGLFFGPERVSLVNTLAVDNLPHVSILYPSYINLIWSFYFQPHSFQLWINLRESIKKK